MPNVSDANRTCQKIGFTEDEFQMQLVSDAKAAVAVELETLFCKVNDSARKFLIPAADLTGPINHNAKESSVLSHNFLHLIRLRPTHSLQSIAAAFTPLTKGIFGPGKTWLAVANLSVDWVH